MSVRAWPNRLRRVADPQQLAGVVIGHMHADHFLDLAGLRYLFPWAGGGAPPLPVHLPPGGRSRLDDLAAAISERPSFFDDSYAIDEYDAGRSPHCRAAHGPLRRCTPLRAGVGHVASKRQMARAWSNSAIPGRVTR